MAAQKLVSFGTKIATTSTRLGFKTLEKGQGLALRAKPHLSWFWGHARVELAPPGLSQWPEIKQGLQKVYKTTITGKFVEKPMREILQNGLVGLEILGWFIIGEMIGRRSIIGYKI
jgi:F-type H+-transporting ATPase subunit g